MRFVPLLVASLAIFIVVIVYRWTVRRIERAEWLVCSNPGMSVLDCDGVDLCDRHRRKRRRLQYLEWQLLDDQKEDGR